ncbi:ATP-binding protein [Anoxybacillus rupiensis]|uniref:ATP-binding protein n=1 Tax=Anoxybacteroides rupiense TaxID=311460 RepID=A0ABD5IVY5_9BACL|nr:ATP-binding protein [Anoxybacillus rupiensis]
MNKYTNNPDGHSLVMSDNLILEHYGLNELNFESVNHYREKFAAVKPQHPWNGLETKEFLYKIGAWGKLRNSSKEGVTVAGLIMFSEERIITEVLPQYFLEYRESTGEMEAANWEKRFTSQDGTWSGNVYDFYFKVMNHMDSSHSFVQSALHEAVINALVHADYSGEGGIVIEKERNIVRLSNPGLLRIPADSAFSSGMSNLRNPNLFKMFILIGLCKRAGSGLKHIQSIWDAHQWKQPEFIQQNHPERTVFTMMFFPVDIAATYETDHQKTIEQEQDEGLDDWIHADIDNSVNKVDNLVNKDLNLLNNDHNSINKSGYSIDKRDYYVNKLDNSLNNALNSINKSSNSVNKRSNSVSKMEYMDSDIHHEEIDEQLWKIAELARKKKRLHPSIMEQMILQLCAQRPLMLKELAYLLERTSDGLRNNYLAKLLEEGKIQLKYPNQPNHPRQAYMTKQHSRIDEM